MIKKDNVFKKSKSPRLSVGVFAFIDFLGSSELIRKYEKGNTKDAFLEDI